MRTDAVGVAVAQFAPTADKADNLRVIDELSGVAAARGAAVVLFPEYASYFVDPFDATLAANAEDLDGAFVAGLTEIAAHRGVVVVAGLVERGGRPRANTVVAVDAAGVGRLAQASPLRRIRQRESDWVEPAPVSAPETFDVGGLTMALMTCYDLRFPEVGACSPTRAPRDPGGCGWVRAAEGAALADASARARH
jgi:predicted amidohydrolase